MAIMIGSPKAQFFASNGDFLSGGKVYTYAAGTLTPIYTYPTIADAEALTNANANPVVLDSRGEANIIVTDPTKFVLKDSSESTIWTVDNIAASTSSTTSTIFDNNGNELLKFSSAASAVNELTISNAATGNKPSIAVTGGDTNAGLLIDAKGSGVIDIGTTSTGAIGLKRSTTITGSCTVSSNITLGEAGTTGTINILGSGGDISMANSASPDPNMTINAKGSGTISIGSVSSGNISLGGGGGLVTCANGLQITGALSHASVTQTTATLYFMPAGTVLMTANTGAAPGGWQLCDGSAISRSTYATLFGIIGTTYGAGNGSTTFNVPNQSTFLSNLTTGKLIIKLF